MNMLSKIEKEIDPDKRLEETINKLVAMSKDLDEKKKRYKKYKPKEK